MGAPESSAKLTLEEMQGVAGREPGRLGPRFPWNELTRSGLGPSHTACATAISGLSSRPRAAVSGSWSLST